MNSIIEKLNAHVESECTKIDREARFDEMLDECYSFDSVGGIFAHMSPSRVLKECDPVAYRCGVSDFEDSEGWIEIAGDYYDQDEAEKAKEAFVEELEIQLSDLEREIEEMEADEDHNVSDLAAKQQQLAALNADLEELNKHSF